MLRPNRTILSIFLLGILAPCLMASPEIPGAPQSRPLLLVGGTIHPVVGEAVDQGELLFADGQILAVGRQLEVPENTETIDITGKHVYPGLFDAYTNMGLIEINAVRATNDLAETGEINPNVRAEVAVNPDSELIPVARSAGVLLCLTAPKGQLISGSSAVIQLDGWTGDEMTLHSRVAMHLNWPNMVPLTDWWVEESAKKQAEQRNKRLELLDRWIANARTYAQAHAETPASSPRETDSLAYDIRLESMIPVMQREIPLIVQADEIQQIQSAVAFALREKLRLIILGGYDAPRCAELLVKHDIPVIVGGIYRLPLRRSDDHDAPFTLPARLEAAGIRYCIAGMGNFGPSNVRNLPYHAAMAAAHGLDRDEALKSVTLYPAQILGVDDRVGSLEVGKDATLIVTSGDPLETSTQVEAAFIQGRRVELNDRHKRLWNKYQEKYRRLK